MYQLSCVYFIEGVHPNKQTYRFLSASILCVAVGLGIVLSRNILSLRLLWSSITVILRSKKNYIIFLTLNCWEQKVKQTIIITISTSGFVNLPLCGYLPITICKGFIKFVSTTLLAQKGQNTICNVSLFEDFLMMIIIFDFLTFVIFAMSFIHNVSSMEEWNTICIINQNFISFKESLSIFSRKFCNPWHFKSEGDQLSLSNGT